MATAQSDQSELEGVASPAGLEDYPLDSLLIRTEVRSLFEVVSRIGQGTYILDPDFERDFSWEQWQQSRLIESVLMRVPLPVFYLAEAPDGKSIIVDGLQRLTTLNRFLNNSFVLTLERPELKGKTFNELPPKLQNRIEDAQLTLYVVDSKVPERVRLDIFERVNSGAPLSRQQMRNALYQGKATRWLREMAQHPAFLEATGHSLLPRTMRDREAVNRFCAFHLLGPERYQGDMDRFLADALLQMNEMADGDLEQMKGLFLRSMQNNLKVFGKDAFRQHTRGQPGHAFNMSLFEVFSTGLARYEESQIESRQDPLREGFYGLMRDDEFIQDITHKASDIEGVKGRFSTMTKLLVEVFRAI